MRLNESSDDGWFTPDGDADHSEIVALLLLGHFSHGLSHLLIAFVIGVEKEDQNPTTNQR